MHREMREGFIKGHAKSDNMPAALKDVNDNMGERKLAHLELQGKMEANNTTLATRPHRRRDQGRRGDQRTRPAGQEDRGHHRRPGARERALQLRTPRPPSTRDHATLRQHQPHPVAPCPRRRNEPEAQRPDAWATGMALIEAHRFQVEGASRGETPRTGEPAAVEATGRCIALTLVNATEYPPFSRTALARRQCGLFFTPTAFSMGVASGCALAASSTAMASRQFCPWVLITTRRAVREYV